MIRRGARVSAAGPGTGTGVWWGEGWSERRGMMRWASTTKVVATKVVSATSLICANIAWHAVTSLFFIQPLVWAFVIVAVILLVNRSAHRHDR